MDKKIKVAIIDNSIDATIYTPVEHWKAYLDTEWDAFRAKEHRFPDLRQGHYSHLILTGSEASILEREKWVEEEIELVQDAAERDIPVLGSCWGHQLLAVIFAGPTHVRRANKPEIGWFPLSIEGDNYLLGELDQAFVFNSHFDEVIGLGPQFVVFASTKDCPNHAFKLKGKSIWGIQSHPEMNIAHAKEYLKNNVARKHAYSSLYSQALDSTPKDSEMIHQVTKNFLQSNDL
ncbi:type 1 glutamine amidotransferase [Acidobacteriota bacterium]